MTQTGKLLDLREHFREDLRDRPRAWVLLDTLFGNPYSSVSRAKGILAVSNPAARQIVELLERRSVLCEISGRTWGRLYEASAIVEALEVE